MKTLRPFLLIFIAVIFTIGLIWIGGPRPALPVPSETVSPSLASKTLVGIYPTVDKTPETTGPVMGRSNKNRSSLHLASGDDPILLIDPKGRKTGYDAASGQVLREIPNSNFSSEALQDISSPPVDYFIDVDQPAEGAYGLVLIGAKSSSYDLTMATFSRDGTRQSSAEMKGGVSPGTEKIFQINFISASDQSSTLIAAP